MESRSLEILFFSFSTENQKEMIIKFELGRSPQNVYLDYNSQLYIINTKLLIEERHPYAMSWKSH